jgi:hypothetical protein
MTLLAELLGSSVFLYGLTQVTSLIANINTADVEFHKLMDQANEYFEFRNIPTVGLHRLNAADPVARRRLVAPITSVSTLELHLSSESPVSSLCFRMQLVPLHHGASHQGARVFPLQARVLAVPRRAQAAGPPVGQHPVGLHKL